MSDDLKERLRTRKVHRKQTLDTHDYLAHEAADRIEELERERDEAHAREQRWRKLLKDAVDVDVGS